MSSPIRGQDSGRSYANMLAWRELMIRRAAIQLSRNYLVRQAAKNTKQI